MIQRPVSQGHAAGRGPFAWDLGALGVHDINIIRWGDQDLGFQKAGSLYEMVLV